jgi:hypothetical protein
MNMGESKVLFILYSADLRVCSGLTDYSPLVVSSSLADYSSLLGTVLLREKRGDVA